MGNCRGPGSSCQAWFPAEENRTMTITDCLGLLSDVATFAGSVVLAWDAATAATKFKNEQFRRRTLESFAGRLPLETKDGQPLQSGEDVQLEALRKIVGWAKIGIGLLVFGFFCQMVTRALEIYIK